MIFRKSSKSALTLAIACLLVASCTPSTVGSGDLDVSELSFTTNVVLNTEEFTGSADASVRSEANNGNGSFLDSSTGGTPLSGRDSFAVQTENDLFPLVSGSNPFSVSGDFEWNPDQPLSVQFRRNGNAVAETLLDVSNINTVALTLDRTELTSDGELTGELVFANDIVDEPGNSTLTNWTVNEAVCQNELGDSIDLSSLASISSNFQFDGRFESGRLPIAASASTILRTGQIIRDPDFDSFSREALNK